MAAEDMASAIGTEATAARELGVEFNNAPISNSEYEVFRHLLERDPETLRDVHAYASWSAHFMGKLISNRPLDVSEADDFIIRAGLQDLLRKLANATELIAAEPGLPMPPAGARPLGVYSFN